MKLTASLPSLFLTGVPWDVEEFVIAECKGQVVDYTKMCELRDTDKCAAKEWDYDHVLDEFGVPVSTGACFECWLKHPLAGVCPYVD